MPLLRNKELKMVKNKVKTKKAPRPDGITPEIVKAATDAEEEWVLNFMNRLLCSRNFSLKYGR